MGHVRFVASSQSDLRSFPEEVRREIGFALHLAEQGSKALNVVPLVGFAGASVLEVISDFDGDTYRAVYTVRFPEALYVLHAFQKKSKRGRATPKMEMDLVKSRLKAAEADYRARSTSEAKERKK